MFNMFKGGKVTMNVTLDRANAVYQPGETIHVSLTIQGEKELKIQQGRVALVYTEEYRERRRERDAGENTSSVHETNMTDNKEIRREVFLQEGAIAANAEKAFNFDIALPGDAAPTYSGRILNTKWAVKATLDRKMAPDVNSQADLRVVSMPQNRRVAAGNFGMANNAGDVEMTFWLPKEEWREGETIEGKLIVNPKKDFDATEVRVELKRAENVPAYEGNTFSDNVAVLKPGAGTQFTAGSAMEYPFSVRIPDKGSPSLRGLHGTATWSLKGVLARRLRADYNVDEEIDVYSP